MAEEKLARRAGTQVDSTTSKRQKRRRNRSEAAPTPRLPEPAFDYRLATNEFGHYCIPDMFAENPVAKTLRAGGIHESATLNLIRRKLGRGDVVTGGAGLGDFLPALDASVAPSAAVHAFESNPDACTAASFMIRLNGLNNVRLHPIVAGKRERELPMPALRGTDSDTMDEVSIDEPHLVRMQRLDQIVPEGRYVSVVHIESYGLEMPAILGGKRIVQECAPTIILKAPRHKTRRFYLSTLQAHFPDHRYQIAGTLDDNCVYVPLNAEG